MKFLKLIQSAALGLLVLSSAAQAEDDTSAVAKVQREPVDVILAAMSEVDQRVSYTGVLSWSNGQVSQNVEVFHQVKDGVQVERISHLDGQPREVIRRGIALDCVQPGRALRRARYAQLSSMAGDIYDLSLIGEDRVAGRLAWRVRMQPKDHYRHAQLLSVDKESGVVLKSLVVDREGRVLESMQFLQLELRDVSDQEVSPHSEQVVAMDNSDNDCINDGLANYSGIDWAISELPAGFELFSAKYFPEKERTWLMYGDGFTTFSVFVEAGDNGRLIQRTGAFTLVAQPISVNDENYTVTVLGDIPPEAVERAIAQLRKRAIQVDH